MDGMTLLNHARNAGMTVEADGGRLRITGSRRHADLARRLIDHKEHVLPILAPAVYETPAKRGENRGFVDVDTNASEKTTLDPVAAMLRRVNLACPTTYVLTDADAEILDTMALRIDAARASGNCDALRDAVADYERTASRLFDQAKPEGPER